MIVTFFVAILNLLRELVKSGFIQRNQPITRTVIAYAKIYPVLTAMLYETGAARVVLLKTTNGGGIPKPGSTLRSSALAEVVNHDIEQVAQVWQNQLVDRDYVHMLSKLHLRSRTFMVTQDLDEDSLLRNLYKANGIAFSKILLVSVQPEMMIYVSVNFKEGTPEVLTAEQREAARAGTNKLKQIFEGKAIG